MKPGPPLRIIRTILVVAFLRHLVLALFIHPYADDLSYAVAGMNTPLAEGWLREYTSWNGRFTSNLLVLRGPLVLGIERGLIVYRAVAIALLLFTTAMAYHFLHVLLPRLDRQAAGTLALVFVLLYLHLMPDASEGFYWYTGAVTYQLANALGLLFLANWIRAWRDPALFTVGWYVAQVALLLWMAGSNEVHMAYLVIGLAVMLFLLRKERDARHRAASVLFVASMVAALVVAAAPGNATREALFPLRHDLLRTVAYSMGQTVRWAFVWILPLALPSVIFLFLLRKGQDRGLVPRVGRRWNAWAAILLPFACLFVSMVVTYWPTGLLGQYRTLNLACFFFIPAWFLALAVCDGAVLRHWVPTPAAVLRPWWSWLIAAGCTLFLWSGRDGLVTADLATGRMSRYDAGMKERYALLTMAAKVEGEKEVVLDEVVQPRCLVVLPLRTDASNWMNRSLATYFGVPSVRVTSAADQATP